MNKTESSEEEEEEEEEEELTEEEKGDVAVNWGFMWLFVVIMFCVQ